MSLFLLNLYTEHIMLYARLELSFGGEIVTTSDMWMIPTLMTESEEELNSLLMKVKEESEKAGLKFSIKKLRSWFLVPSLHGKYKGKRWKQ